MGAADHQRGVVTRFKVTTGASPKERRRNVAHALSLGLPELERAPARPERLSILASGMSFHESPVGLCPTLAVNGALGLMMDRGDIPTWWAGCDPQALLADFLREPPAETIYLIASTCHPDVFDALKGRCVLLWHVNDDDGSQGYRDLIAGRPSALRLSSITLEAFALADMLGFSRTQTWGWDGCMRGTRHHATGQQESREIITARVDGTVIPTTRVWLYELVGASGLFAHCPSDVTIHGDGLFARALTRAGLVNQSEHV